MDSRRKQCRCNVQVVISNEDEQAVEGEESEGTSSIDPLSQPIGRSNRSGLGHVRQDLVMENHEDMTSDRGIEAIDENTVGGGERGRSAFRSGVLGLVSSSPLGEHTRRQKKKKKTPQQQKTSTYGRLNKPIQAFVKTLR